MFSAATYYGMRAATMLVVTEEVMIGRGFLGESTEAEREAIRTTTDLLMDVALEIGFTEGE